MSLNSLKELEKLSELKNKGIITEAEFEIKKHQLLNKDNSVQNKDKPDGTYWLPIPSFILSIIVFFASFSSSIFFDEDELIGFITCLVISFILGAITLAIQRNGRGLAIAAIILTIFATLIFVGQLDELNELENIFNE